MAKDLRSIKRRINTVGSIQKITRAMDMVSTAKFKKAEAALMRLRPYGAELRDLVSKILQQAKPEDHPLLVRQDHDTPLLIVVSSDRGLCGSFNVNIVNLVEDFLAEDIDRARRTKLYFIGKKAREAMKKAPLEVIHYMELPDPPTHLHARQIVEEVTTAYLNGVISSVWVFFGRFVSSVSQVPAAERLLPLGVQTDDDALGPDVAGTGAEMPHGVGLAEAADDWTPPEAPPFGYELDPDQETMLQRILPLHLETRILVAMLESWAAEYAARMSAMHGATKAAQDMIDRLTLQYNRARQDAITKELMEIVSGAEAIS